MRGIDVSVYSGPISVEKWRKVKADGYDLAIIGLFHGRTVNRYAGQQLGAAIQAGLDVAAYVLIAPWTGWNGAQQVAAGLAEARVHHGSLRFVAVDVEIDGVTEAMVREALDAVEQMGHRPIIYTGWWWWYGHFNDCRAFSHIPLWTADYDGEAALDTRMYGGWTKAVGKQYAGTTMLHDINCDLNVFDEAFVKREEMPPFTEEQEGRIKEIVNWCGPGLEMQARVVICRALCGLEAAVMAGDWGALPSRLALIKELAQDWHRWEGE